MGRWYPSERRWSLVDLMSQHVLPMMASSGGYLGPPQIAQLSVPPEPEMEKRGFGCKMGGPLAGG